MDIDIFKSEVINSLEKTIENSIISEEENNDRFSISFENSLITVYPWDKKISIRGTLSLSALGIAKRIGLYFSHWNYETMITIIYCEERKLFFKDRLISFLNILFIFPNLDLEKWFEGKKVVAYLKQDTGIVELHLTEEVCSMFCHYSKELYTVEVENKEEVKDPEKAKKLMEEAIEKEEVKGTAVHGDIVEGI